MTQNVSVCSVMHLMPSWLIAILFVVTGMFGIPNFVMTGMLQLEMAVTLSAISKQTTVAPKLQLLRHGAATVSRYWEKSFKSSSLFRLATKSHSQSGSLI